MGGDEDGGTGDGWEIRAKGGLGCGEKFEKAQKWERGSASGLWECNKCKIFYRYFKCKIFYTNLP